MSDVNTTARKLKAVFQAVAQHLNEGTPSYMLIDYITEAVAEKIQYESQIQPTKVSEAEEQICPHCEGSCEIFNGSAGEMIVCEDCKGHGIIKA